MFADIPLLSVCVHSGWKGHFRIDLYCVGQDFTPFSLAHCFGLM